jgi:preprotein translocase subunit SecG
MYFILVILSLVACVLLGAIVLIQNPKGGGLTSNFSSSSQLMGVQKTGDFLEKGTWVLAIAIMVLSIAINISTSTKGAATKNVNAEQEEAAKKASTPTAPTNSAPVSLPATPAPAKK